MSRSRQQVQQEHLFTKEYDKNPPTNSCFLLPFLPSFKFWFLLWYQSISFILEEWFHFKFWISHKHLQILSIKNYGMVHRKCFLLLWIEYWCPSKFMLMWSVLCCGIFGGSLVLDEVMGWSPQDKIGALIYGRTDKFSLPCEDTRRVLPGQEGCPHLTPDLQEPWFWTFSLQNCKNYGYLLFKAPSLWWSSCYNSLN